MKHTLVLLAALLLPLAALGCEGQMVKAPLAETPYDPLSNDELLIPVQIVIRNTGPVSCRYKVTVERLAFDRQTLPFAVGFEHDAKSVVTPLVPPGEDVGLEITLGIEAAIMTAPGTRSLTFTASVKSESPGIELDRETFGVPVRILPVVSLTIAGVGPRGKMNFGELIQGAQRSVTLQTKGNTAYRLDISSKNRGLSLGGGAAHQLIQYDLLIDGAMLSKPTATIEVTSLHGDASHVITAQIGPVGMAAAGSYTDTLTIAIGLLH